MTFGLHSSITLCRRNLKLSIGDASNYTFSESLLQYKFHIILVFSDQLEHLSIFDPCITQGHLGTTTIGLCGIPGGGHLYFWLNIILVKGLSKHTRNTYFSGMKIDSKYAFLHALSLICPSCPFQTLSLWPKTHLFFSILHGSASLNDVRAYIAWSWKTTLITWIFYEDDIQLHMQVPPQLPPPPRISENIAYGFSSLQRKLCSPF